MPAVVANRQDAGILRLALRRQLFTQRSSSTAPAPLRRGEQAHQFLALRKRCALPPVGAHAFERLRKARIVDRLQQVVERLRLERIQRISDRKPSRR